MEEQSRQRDVEQKEVDPLESALGDLLELAASEPDKNQTEIRECEIEKIDHRLK
jgi:hypothetical protein